MAREIHFLDIVVSVRQLFSSSSFFSYFCPGTIFVALALGIKSFFFHSLIKKYQVHIGKWKITLLGRCFVYLP